jgi:hypothetical protein
MSNSIYSKSSCDLGRLHSNYRTGSIAVIGCNRLNDTDTCEIGVDDEGEPGSIPFELTDTCLHSMQLNCCHCLRLNLSHFDCN